MDPKPIPRSLITNHQSRRRRRRRRRRILAPAVRRVSSLQHPLFFILPSPVFQRKHVHTAVLFLPGASSASKRRQGSDFMLVFSRQHRKAPPFLIAERPRKTQGTEPNILVTSFLYSNRSRTCIHMLHCEPNIQVSFPRRCRNPQSRSCGCSPTPPRFLFSPLLLSSYTTKPRPNQYVSGRPRLVKSGMSPSQLKLRFRASVGRMPAAMPAW